jgi:hypothetical protein
MLWVSEILLRHHDLACFEDLVAVVRARARDGERFLRMDVRPPFHDTPEDWESRLEAAFTGVVDDR